MMKCSRFDTVRATVKSNPGDLGSVVRCGVNGPLKHFIKKCVLENSSVLGTLTRGVRVEKLHRSYYKNRTHK